MIDLLLIACLIALIVAYVVVVRNRKKKDKQLPFEVDNSGKQSTFARRAMEIKHEADKKRMKQIVGHLTDYSEYHMSKKEYIFYVAAAFATLYFLGYLFYENVLIALVIGAIGFWFPKLQRKALLEKRKDKLNIQFKEAITSLSSSLAAGRSIENSFREVVHDLKMLYPDPNTYIIREFEIINRRVENGETIERAIQDFARRSDCEDILNFADVFITCKRTGGNLVEVIRRTADIIGEKVDIQQEVQVMIAQKKFESRILTVMPIGMIALLKSTSGEYLSPLYTWGGAGPFIMTICFGILVFSFWLSQRIMNIKV